MSPNALAVALALAAHVPFDGSRLKAWPSWTRIKFMCGIGSRDTVSRALQELEQHGLIEVGRKKDRRKSNVYTLHFVTVPEHVIERTLRAVEKASQAGEHSKVRSPETGPLRSPETGLESSQCKSIKKKEREEGRGTHGRPPRNDAKTIVSHPLPSASEANARHADKASDSHMESKEKTPTPDLRPWLKVGLTRRQWNRKQRQADTNGNLLEPVA